MPEMDVWAAWRVTNFGLCLAAGVLVHWRLWTLRKVLTGDEKKFMVGALLAILALAVASLEGYLQEQPFGARVALTTLVALYVIVGMADPPSRHQGVETRPYPSWWRGRRRG